MPRRLLFLPVLACLAVAPAARAATRYAPGAVLVKMSGAKLTKAERSAGATGAGVPVRGTGARLVPVSGDPATAARRLARTKAVAWAEPNYAMRALADAPVSPALPDDPLLPQQPDVAAVGAPVAWSLLGLGAGLGWPVSGGVPVGIVDSGIDASHEDLAGRIAACATSTDGVVQEGACDDDNGHGSHVAGTIGATTGNGAGMAGIAPSSPLIVCKALQADGSGTVADVAACIGWAHGAGARIISLSLGGPSSRTLTAAVEDAWARGGKSGSLIVAAAGNDGDDSLEYPAALAGVVSVAAVDDSGAPASFSNANDDVELAAPGVNVLSVKAGGGYVRYSGTSMATPHVAGVAALALDAHPGTASALRKRLDATARDLLAPGRDPATGFGLVDAAAAVAP